MVFHYMFSKIVGPVADLEGVTGEIATPLWFDTFSKTGQFWYSWVFTPLPTFLGGKGKKLES